MNIFRSALVWWFKIFLHLWRETFKKASEPKPHRNHNVLMSFSTPKFAPVKAAEVANFGFGTLARCPRFRQMWAGAHRSIRLMAKPDLCGGGFGEELSTLPKPYC
jgi:hypothetical protein